MNEKGSLDNLYEAIDTVGRSVKAMTARMFEFVNLSAGFIAIIFAGFGLIKDKIILTVPVKITLGTALCSFGLVMLIYPLYVHLAKRPLRVKSSGDYYVPKDKFKKYMRRITFISRMKIISPLLFILGLVSLVTFGILAITGKEPPM